ncbi:VIT1/CCC1 transporter family protein [Streptomyces sp. L7]
MSFTVGALLPLLAIVLPPADWRLGGHRGVVAGRTAPDGLEQRTSGAADTRPAMLRNVMGGALAMGVTYAAGALLGAVGV